MSYQSTNVKKKKNKKKRIFGVDSSTPYYMTTINNSVCTTKTLLKLSLKCTEPDPCLNFCVYKFFSYKLGNYLAVANYSISSWNAKAFQSSALSESCWIQYINVLDLIRVQICVPVLVQIRQLDSCSHYSRRWWNAKAF